MAGKHDHAVHADGREYADRGTADNRLRNGREHRRAFGQQARNEQDSGGKRKDHAVDDFVLGDDADVLAKRGRGDATQKAREHAHQTVGDQTARDLAISRGSIERGGRNGSELAHNLHGVNDSDDTYHGTRRRVEHQTMGAQRRRSKPAGGRDGREIDHTQRGSHDKASANAGKDAAQPERTLAVVARHKGDDKRYERDGPVGDTAKIGSTLPTRHGRHGDRAQRQADHKDDGAEHRSRKQKTHAPKQQAKEDDERAADNLGAQHGLEAKLETDRLECRHKREARAHHDGQSRADDTFYGELLKENVERREDQRRLNDGSFLLRGKAADRRDDDSGRDDTRECRQHML